MRRAAFVLLALLALSGLGAAFSGPAAAAVSPSPSASSYTLTLIVDRGAADANSTITFTLYLNVTSGQVQLASVNLSVEPELTILAASATVPADCAPSSSNLTFAQWQCSFLRSGRSYRWTLPVMVAVNAIGGRYRVATATALEFGGGPTTPQQSQASVWIVAAALHLMISAKTWPVVDRAKPIDLVINVTNVQKETNDTALRANQTAYDVVLTVDVSPGLDIGLVTPTRFAYSSLTPESSIYVNLTAIVRSATDRDFWVNATIEYHDVTNHTVGPDAVQLFMRLPPENPLPLSASTVLAVIAFALLAILGAVTIVPALGERKVEIDEVFLMHRSGILIQHISRGPGLRKDDDLVASMFVAIQEFVRDSFDTKATLDEIAFGGRRAAVLRGKHIVLAALISRGSPRYLFPQMKAVERALERAHGASLADWDGRVARLDQAGPILQAFVRGGFRRYRGWRRR